MASGGQHDGGVQANQLNRELLRWIQSLDLAYSIKNVKRDFANGFLVAEIMSRYYDKDISMHSYDNGIGVKVKKDNWDQLHRVFSRVSDLEPLTSKSDIDAVIHCQNGAAVSFVTKLYQCLTKRTIQPSVASTSNTQTATAAVARSSVASEEIPPYAKPTGTAVIRDKMRGADIAEMSDETEINRKVRSLHSQHEEQLQLERLLAMDTPERYPSLRSASKATVLRGATKPVRNDESPALGTQNVVKEVQIKSMNEKSLEKLRMNREAKESEAYAQSHGGLHGGGGGGGGGGGSSSATSLGASFDHSTRNGGGGGASGGLGGGGAGAGELIQKRRPQDLLNEAVARKLPPQVVSRIEQRGKDKFDAFVDALHQDGRVLSDQDGAAMLTQILDDPLVLAHAFLEFPREFWRFVGALLPFLTQHDEQHALFVCVHHALLRIGRHCVKRDANASLVLLTDYVLPKITPVLGPHASKRAPLLQIVYAFASESVLAHIQVIKRLREALPDDIPLFIHALSILLYMEPELDDTLVDLYHYYACIGLETSCEKLRAASLSMLVPFLKYDLGLVVDLLPRLTQFSSRSAWWEVKTQLLIVASAFLHAVSSSSSSSSFLSSSSAAPPTRDFTEQIELALTVIEREFHPNASLNVRRVGLSYLAKNLSQYQELVPLYVDVLLSVPLAMRSLMLHSHSPETREEEEGEEEGEAPLPSASTLPIRGTSGAIYMLPPLAPQWDSVAVAKQIFYERKARPQADVDALQVILACFMELLARQATLSDAAALFEQTKSYVALALGDAAACGAACQVLVEVVRHGACSAEETLGGDAVAAALRPLVSRSVEDIRQQTAVKMLHDVHSLGEEEAAAVRRCVQALKRQSDASVFAQSLFAIALDT